MKYDDKKPIGYKSPPEGRRFPKGVSGNPNGRPKKQGIKDLNVIELFTKCLSKKLPTTIDGKQVEMTALELLITSNLHSAIKKGNFRALEFIFKRVDALKLRDDKTLPPVLFNVSFGNAPPAPMPPEELKKLQAYGDKKAGEE